MTVTEVVAAGGADRTAMRPRRRRMSVSLALSLIVVVGIGGAAVVAPLIAPYDPFALQDTMMPPSATYPLGTDALGHDMLSYLIWGGRTSLIFAVGASLVSLLVGILVGAIPTMLGNVADQLGARAVELVLMIPQLFLLITAVALVGSSTWIVVLIIGLTLWPANAKIMRNEVLSLRGRPFAEAASVAGLSRMGILFRHIIPNGIGPVIANSSLQMGYAVLMEAGLDFLGLGDPNHPSWGQALNAGQSYMTTAPWLVIFPGLILVMLMLALNRIGEAVSDALIPKGVR